MAQSQKSLSWLPFAVAAVCALAFAGWLNLPAPHTEAPRTPQKWNRTGATRKELKGADVTTAGPGKPSAAPGDWPHLRGPKRDNIAVPVRPLARAWPAGGPKVLWRIAVGEGHAGATVHNGRVYLIDYDNDKKLDVIRCLSFDDGQEIWRTAYPVMVKQNHGRSRTVPAVTDRFVVTIGPKHHVYCCDAATGKVVWKKDLMADFGTGDLPWYAGQCPLIDGDRVILAPGGKPLMMAVELASGREIWRVKGADEMGVTHSSIAIMTFGGQKQYVYLAHDGIFGIAADSGAVLWTLPVWKKAQAYVPTPLVIDGERILFSAGYGAGCQMVKLAKEGDKIKAAPLWTLPASVFGADQQTPILYKDHIFGTLPPVENGELGCLDLSGKRLWNAGATTRMGLGPYLITADGLILALSDRNGTLHLGSIDPAGYKELAQHKIVKGSYPWGPMALAGSRLILRDETEMLCVDLGQ